MNYTQQQTNFKIVAMATLLAISPLASADKGKIRYSGHAPAHEEVGYAKVIDVTPVYKEVRHSTPVKECWQEPVTRSKRVRSHSGNTAGATLAGGIIGGIIGHQFGKGRGNKAATAVGTIIGAQVGHDSARGSHADSYTQYTAYEDFCEVKNHVTYEEVLDSYQVTYRYHGQEYSTSMPYKPGKKLKVRVSVEPLY